MRNPQANSAAHSLFVFASMLSACSNSSQPVDGGTVSGTSVGGSTAGPANGGASAATIGGSVALASPETARSPAGAGVTARGQGAGGAAVGAGGKPSVGTETPARGNSSGATETRPSDRASAGASGVATSGIANAGGRTSGSTSNAATGGRVAPATGAGPGGVNTGGMGLGGGDPGRGGRTTAVGGTQTIGAAGTVEATAAAGSGTAARSAGCGKTSTLTFGTVPGESGQSVGVGDGGYVKIQSGGVSRGFALRLPDNYDKNKPYWLIFGFHWNGGNSKEVDTGGSNGYSMAHFGLQKLSNNGAIFVAPDGLNSGWGGDNLPFVDDMVKLIEDNYCVDTTHLFTNGFSYGGGMSYAIACARAKVFRGAAIYEGAVLSGCAGGNDPIAYWQMAGTTDGTCTIDMATPMRDRFAKNNGCAIPTTEPPRPKSISESHICTDYTGCSTGHPLRWCVHPAGHGNAIVDGTSDLYNSCATPPKSCSTTCPCTWVPADVWSFFKSL